MRDGTGAMSEVLLVGGASEVGQAIVRALPLRREATVWLAARRDPRPDWPAPPADIEHLHWDAHDTDSHHDLLAQIPRDLDVVVVAVGVLGDQERSERDPEYAATVAATNFTRLIPILLAVADRLRQQGHGTLVVLSSVAGVRTRRANFVYGASKAGLDGFALGLGDILVDSGASVLVVRPGFITGRMTRGLPAAPLATTPEQVAVAVARRLSSRPAGVLWVPASLRAVFAGLQLLPRPVFRRLPG